MDVDNSDDKSYYNNKLNSWSFTYNIIYVLSSLFSQQGSGFGEYAILSSAHKIRTCAAVALDDDCILLVVHADTYNITLRDHHYRIKQLSSSIAFLQELPLFKQLTPSTLNSIAYTLKSQVYVKHDIIINKGDIINNLFIILTGNVKAYASVIMNDDNNNEKNEKSINKTIDTINEKTNTKNNDKKTNTKNNDKNIKIVIKNDKKVNSSNTKTNTTATTDTSTTTTSSTIDKNNIVQTNKKRIPTIAISMFGRGKIIGESEVFKDLSNFEFSYEIATIGTELLLMPATVFREAMSADHFKQSDAYKIIESNSINNSLINNSSTNSINTIKQANDMMKNFIIDDKSELRARNQVDVALPTLLNQPTTSTTSLKSSSFSINNSNSNSVLSVSSLVEKHLKNVQASMMTNSISSTSPTAATIKAKFSTLPVSISTSSTNTTTPSTPPTTTSTNASTTIASTSSSSPSSTTLKISPSPPINNNSNKKKNSITDKTSPRKIIGGLN